MTVGKRRHKRYPVSGSAEFQKVSLHVAGELVNIGNGGVLIRSEVKLPQGTNIMVRFKIRDYPAVFEANGGVVHTHPDRMGLMFLQEPAGLEALISWLEKQEQNTVVGETVR